jgi:hypothetical protein
MEKATTASIINVVLSEEGQALQEIVVTGSRTPVRSNTKSTNRRSIRKGSSFYRTNYFRQSFTIQNTFI